MQWKTLAKRVGKNLKFVRKSKNLSQEAVAELAQGLSVRQLQNIEAGNANCTLRSLTKIAKALHVDPKIFFESK